MSGNLDNKLKLAKEHKLDALYNLDLSCDKGCSKSIGASYNLVVKNGEIVIENYKILPYED